MPLVEKEGFEADDIIGTLARNPRAFSALMSGAMRMMPSAK